jgi:hypothetical protein
MHVRTVKNGSTKRPSLRLRALRKSRRDNPRNLCVVSEWPGLEYLRQTTRTSYGAISGSALSLVRHLSSCFLAQEHDSVDGMKQLTEAEITAACEAWTRVWRRAAVAQQPGTHPFRLRVIKP